MNKQTKIFLEDLYKRELGGWGRWRTRQTSVDTTIRFLSDLKKKEFIEIISDLYWNRYATYKEHIEITSPIYMQPYGPHIGFVINRLFDINDKLTDSLLKKSEGIFLLSTLDRASGSNRLKIARRARRSTDVRVRKRVVKILPVSQLNSFKSDADSGVRRLFIKRIGIDNCAKDFINDKNPSLRSMAISAAPLNSFNYIKILDEFLELCKRPGPWRRWDPKVRAVRSIISRMGPEELIYYLNLSGNDQDIDDILSNKLES